MKTALVVIAHKGFQDHELEGTVEGLRSGGFEIVLASTETGTCIGKFGSEVEATVAISDTHAADYDRIAFIGGPGAAELQHNKDAQRLAQETVQAGKVLGAICIAPTILARAGVLKGKKATVWNNDGKQDIVLTEHGATYTAEDVTIDGRIVTGNGPEAALEFGKSLASL